jgi:hypothetical protein
MSGTRVSYHDDQQPLEGYLAAHASGRNLPGALVMPSWLNINESTCRRADRLAELGYAVPARTRISVQGSSELPPGPARPWCSHGLDYPGASNSTTAQQRSLLFLLSLRCMRPSETL